MLGADSLDRRGGHRDTAARPGRPMLAARRAWPRWSGCWWRPRVWRPLRWWCRRPGAFVDGDG